MKLKAHRQLLQRHVVHDLVVAALEEGGVDRGEGAEALAGQARGKGDRVLLRDADVKDAVGEALLEPADQMILRNSVLRSAAQVM